jgi:hypothetical protein
MSGMFASSACYIAKIVTQSSHSRYATDWRLGDNARGQTPKHLISWEKQK